jgi:hypothetical protein
MDALTLDQIRVFLSVVDEGMPVVTRRDGAPRIRIMRARERELPQPM